jgi:hypothetical protein
MTCQLMGRAAIKKRHLPKPESGAGYEWKLSLFVDFT